MEPTTAVTLFGAASSALTETTIPALDFANMTPLQLVLVAVLMLMSLALRIWMKLNSAKLSNEELARGQAAADLATAAAEEVGAREGWTGAQKLAYAREMVQVALPKAKPEFRDALVHGSLAVLNLGNTGASDIRKPENVPDAPAR